MTNETTTPTPQNGNGNGEGAPSTPPHPPLPNPSATVGELAAQATTQTVRTDAMLPGADTQVDLEIPVGDGPANTRIVQAVYPTPVGDPDVAGAGEVQAKADEENAKGYVGWRPGDTD